MASIIYKHIFFIKDTRLRVMPLPRVPAGGKIEPVWACVELTVCFPQHHHHHHHYHNDDRHIPSPVALHWKITMDSYEISFFLSTVQLNTAE